MPPALRAAASVALCDQPGSLRLYVTKTSKRYSASTPRSSHFASRTRRANRAGSGVEPRGAISFVAAPFVAIAKSLRQHDRVAQHDARAAHFDVAAGLQVFHHAAHHLARSADHLGDVLLRQPLGDDLLAVDVLRHVQEEARHPTVDVEQREAADLAVGL